MKAENNYPAFLTPRQIANILQVTPRTVVRLIDDGELPAYRVGGSWRVAFPKFRDFMIHSASADFDVDSDLQNAFRTLEN